MNLKRLRGLRGLGALFQGAYIKTGRRCSLVPTGSRDAPDGAFRPVPGGPSSDGLEILREQFSFHGPLTELVVNPRLGLRGELAPYMFPAVTDQEEIGFPIVCHSVLPSALVTSGAGVCLFVILRVLILDLSY